MVEKEIVFVLGGPGSGKGTQALTIAQDYGLGYLSTGDLLRAATDESQTPDDPDQEFLDRRDQLRQIMESGQLVPDEIILALVKAEIDKSDAQYYFVDGFPRKVSQAEAFENEIAAPKAVLFLDGPDGELTQRLLKRGETSGSTDDNAESIAKRLKTYHDQSYPVIEYYTPEAKVIKINGYRSKDAVKADILFELRKFWDIPFGPGNLPGKLLSNKK
jgi:adenylate kinase